MDQMIQYQLRRAVTGRQRLASKGTEPVPLIEKLLASLTKVYRHKKLQTHFKFDDDALFHGEQGDLMELMGNLLDNACKFAISEVKVTVRRHLERLRIEVEDDGPGIDPAKSEQIFQRGVRADSSPGQGIGLAVVTEIVHSYGGQIRSMNPPRRRPLYPGLALIGIALLSLASNGPITRPPTSGALWFLPPKLF